MHCGTSAVLVITKEGEFNQGLVLFCTVQVRHTCSGGILKAKGNTDFPN